MPLPPDVPARVDLFWCERLGMVRIERASERLAKEALDAALPFVPLDG